MKYVTISAKTCIVRTSMYIEKKLNLKIICEITHATGKNLQGLIGPAISEGSFKNKKKLHTILLAWLWRIRKSVSLNGECVTCVCLQCSRCKQNRYRFFGKTATIDKCLVSLRVISIAYLIGQSLVKILSQIPAL